MATVVETLEILFKTNAEQTEANMEQMNDSIDQFGEHAKESSGHLGEMKSRLMEIAAIAGISLGVGDIFSSQEQALSIGNAAQVLGTNVSSLYSWGQAVERQGGSVNGFIGSMQSLNDQMLEFQKTGGGSLGELAARIGFNPFEGAKGAMGALPEIANLLHGMSGKDAQFWGKKLGLSEATILLLHKGGAAAQALVDKYKQFGVETQKNYEDSQKFHIALGNIEQMTQMSAMSLGALLIPALQDAGTAMEDFVGFVQNNGPFIEKVFKVLAAALLVYYLPALAEVAIANIAAFAPLYAIIGLAVLIALAWQDVNYYLHGQSSLIGVFLSKYPRLKGVVTEILDEFRKMGPVIEKALGGFVTKLGQGIKTVFDLIKMAFEFITLFISEPDKALANLKKNLAEIKKDLMSFFKGTPIAKIIGEVQSVKDDFEKKGAVSGTVDLGKKILGGEVDYGKKIGGSAMTGLEWLGDHVMAMLEGSSASPANYVQNANDNSMNNYTSQQVNQMAQNTINSTNVSNAAPTHNITVQVTATGSGANQIASSTRDHVESVLREHLAHANMNNASGIK